MQIGVVFHVEHVVGALMYVHNYMFSECNQSLFVRVRAKAAFPLTTRTTAEKTAA